MPITQSSYRQIKTLAYAGLLLALLLTHLPAQAISGIQFVKSGADFNTALYEEETIDIQVKTLGNLIKHKRYLNGGSWQFNPNWASLTLEFYTGNTTTTPDSIRRNRFIYTKTGSGSEVIYKFDARRKILKTANGFRWSDRKGSWIDYDNAGHVVAFSNSNNLKVYLKRNSAGQIAQIEDHNHDLVLTYSYYANGLLQKVTDYKSRSVHYDYGNITAEVTINKRGEISGAQLTKVTDVLGKPWIYNYDTYDMVGERIDPTGEILTIINQKITRSACEYWVGGYWFFDIDRQLWRFTGFDCLKTVVFEPPVTLVSISGSEQPPQNYTYFFNKNREEWTLATNYEEGRMSASTFNNVGERIRLVKNGRTVEAVYIEGNTYTSADENGNKPSPAKMPSKTPCKSPMPMAAKQRAALIPTSACPPRSPMKMAISPSINTTVTAISHKCAKQQAAAQK